MLTQPNAQSVCGACALAPPNPQSAAPAPASLAPRQELSRVQPLPGCAAPKVEYRQLDLGSLASVRKFARDFNRSGRPLDLLVCNAGVCVRACAAGQGGPTSD
jgi:NAD(P)-dependent dehydrogenase (short-subunit alcohol dehydrogenase family)